MGKELYICHISSEIPEIEDSKIEDSEIEDSEIEDSKIKDSKIIMHKGKN